MFGMNFSGSIEWYNQIEPSFEGKTFGNSRCKGVAINENKDVAVSLEIETGIESGAYDVYLVTIGQTLSRRNGVIIQSTNFNDQVGISSQGLIAAGGNYFFAGQTNGYNTNYKTRDAGYPGSFVYRVDLDRNHQCI